MGSDYHRHPPSHTPILANMVEPVVARSERTVENERARASASASAGIMSSDASGELSAARMAGQLEPGSAKAAGGGGGSEGGGGSSGEGDGGLREDS